jgi:hypothetical protein
MRKYYVCIFILMSACHYHYGAGKISISDIRKIEIKNGTNNKYIADKIIVDDLFSRTQIISQINNLREVNEQNVKNNFGEYNVRLYYYDNTFKDFVVIYTVYDGVVIRSGDDYSKYYKNDQLEERILFLFQK